MNTGSFSTSTLGRGSGKPEVFEGEPVTGQFLSVICTNVQYLT